MHLLQVMGIPPESLSSVIGVIKNVPDLCMLIHQDDEPGAGLRETERYTGPLLEAPEGIYYLAQGRPTEPLIIAARKYMLGTRVLFTRDTKNERECYLDERARLAFSDLLRRSEKLVHVYQEEMTGVQKYQFLFPGIDPGEAYPSRPTYLYQGVADLQTGKVVRG